MGFLKEFKEFAVKGNVIDMSVGVVIGTAFSAIVTSLVNDIFMPVLGIITGGMDLSGLALTVGEGEGAAVLAYGAFLNAIINFLLIALCLFLFVKAINRLRRKKEVVAPAPAPKRLCPYCRQEIADDATRCPHCTSAIE